MPLKITFYVAKEILGGSQDVEFSLNDEPIEADEFYRQCFYVLLSEETDNKFWSVDEISSQRFEYEQLGYFSKFVEEKYCETFENLKYGHFEYIVI